MYGWSLISRISAPWSIWGMQQSLTKFPYTLKNVSNHICLICGDPNNQWLQQQEITKIEKNKCLAFALWWFPIMEVPPNHQFYEKKSHYKPGSYGGTPMTMETTISCRGRHPRVTFHVSVFAFPIWWGTDAKIEWGETQTHISNSVGMVLTWVLTDFNGGFKL